MLSAALCSRLAVVTDLKIEIATCCRILRDGLVLAKLLAQVKRQQTYAIACQSE